MLKLYRKLITRKEMSWYEKFMKTTNLIHLQLKKKKNQRMKFLIFFSISTFFSLTVRQKKLFVEYSNFILSSHRCFSQNIVFKCLWKFSSLLLVVVLYSLTALLSIFLMAGSCFYACMVFGIIIMPRDQISITNFSQSFKHQMYIEINNDLYNLKSIHTDSIVLLISLNQTVYIILL